MGKKVMTKVEKSIHEESEKISEARRAIKAQKNIIDNSDIIPEELDDKDWREKEFSFPNNTVRIGTVFSGIGAIEHAFQRLKLKHKIIFAGDIEKMKNEGDTVSGMTDSESPSSYVRWNEHDNT